MSARTVSITSAASSDSPSEGVDVPLCRRKRGVPQPRLDRLEVDDGAFFEVNLGPPQAERLNPTQARRQDHHPEARGGHPR